MARYIVVFHHEEVLSVLFDLQKLLKPDLIVHFNLVIGLHIDVFGVHNELLFLVNIHPILLLHLALFFYLPQFSDHLLSGLLHFIIGGIGRATAPRITARR